MDKFKKNLMKKRNRSENSSEENSSLSDEISQEIPVSSKKKTENNFEKQFDKSKKNKPVMKSDDEDEDIIVNNEEISFCLTSKKRLTIRKFKGNILVDLREFWTDEKGVNRPSKKGIALTPDNWEKIKRFSDKIDEAIRNMK